MSNASHLAPYSAEGDRSTLAQALEITAPVSTLLRKGRRLGLRDLDDILGLTVQRGCKHYAMVPDGKRSASTNPTPDELPNDQLTILLLVGEHPYQPLAIRCAAQLARSADVRAERLVELAIREKCERVLTHIAKAGFQYDTVGVNFWKRILERLPELPARTEPRLPHWTRFVSMPGIQRNGPVAHRWLIPQP
jgi:hypothetical protein